jgi:integrase
MARRRYQRGSVDLRGKRELVWIGRWREDVIDSDGKTRRVCKKVVLGNKRELPTKKLALRELADRLAPINSLKYRGLRNATFGEFARIWKENALTQHKPSTQSTINTQLKNWLLPFFGDIPMREIDGELVQGFIQSCTLCPNSRRNMILSMKMMWRQARCWNYVPHDDDPFSGLVLPKRQRRERFFFTVEQIQRIITKASEPQKTLYRLAVETGLRAGELCGLRVEDLDLENALVSVKQSVWRGTAQSPKTNNAVRTISISEGLARHLQHYLKTWRPNALGLVFATRSEKPWAPCNLMRRHLHPLLDSLGIQRCGLHTFRHSNGSLMDRLNAPMKIRQERLGHAAGSTITMERYTHSVTEDDRRTANQIGQLLCPAVQLCPDVSKFVGNETTRLTEVAAAQ